MHSWLSTPFLCRWVSAPGGSIDPPGYAWLVSCVYQIVSGASHCEGARARFLFLSQGAVQPLLRTRSRTQGTRCVLCGQTVVGARFFGELVSATARTRRHAQSSGAVRGSLGVLCRGGVLVLGLAKHSPAVRTPIRRVKALQLVAASHGQALP